MKKVFFILLLLSESVFLSNCSKNNDEEKPDKEYTYIINLQANNILSYQKYNGDGDTLLEEATYQYSDEQIVKTLVREDKIAEKTIYILDNGIAAECFDTVFYNNTANSFYRHLYTHVDGKLVKDEFEHKFYTGNELVQINWVHEYEYDENGNITKLTRTANDGSGSVTCSDGFTYATGLNFFEVNNFDARIIGALSTNLTKQRTYDSGCPVSPGWIYSSSIFNYVTIEGGLVVKMTENLDSGYRITSNTYQYIYH